MDLICGKQNYINQNVLIHISGLTIQGVYTEEIFVQGLMIAPTFVFGS